PRQHDPRCAGRATRRTRGAVTGPAGRIGGGGGRPRRDPSVPHPAGRVRDAPFRVRGLTVVSHLQKGPNGPRFTTPYASQPTTVSARPVSRALLPAHDRRPHAVLPVAAANTRIGGTKFQHNRTWYWPRNATKVN